MGKIYYTDEEVEKKHKRFRVCKNKGNDCEKNEFMAKHMSTKFCSEDCNNKFSNWEKQQLRKRIYSPKHTNFKILTNIVQNNQMPITSYNNLLGVNFKFEEMESTDFIPSFNRKGMVFGEFVLVQWGKDTFLIIKK